MLVVIPRHNSDEMFEKRVVELKRSGTWEGVRILSLCPEFGGERAVCLDLQTKLGEGVSVVPIHSLSALLDEVAGAGLVLTQRYHGALAALAIGKTMETVPQGQGDKLSELASMKREDFLSLAKAGEIALREAVKCLARGGE